MEAPSSVCSSIIIVNGAEGGEEEEDGGGYFGCTVTGATRRSQEVGRLLDAFRNSRNGRNSERQQALPCRTDDARKKWRGG